MQTLFLKFSVLSSVSYLVLTLSILSHAQTDKSEDVKLHKASEEKTDLNKPEQEKSEKSEKTVKTQGQTASFSGEVFVIRSTGKTEVYFRNHNQSYIIPKGNKHNTILKEIQKRSKSNQVVSVNFNPKTREILEVKEIDKNKESNKSQESNSTSQTDSSR